MLQFTDELTFKNNKKTTGKQFQRSRQHRGIVANGTFVSQQKWFKMLCFYEVQTKDSNMNL